MELLYAREYTQGERAWERGYSIDAKVEDMSKPSTTMRKLIEVCGG